MHSLKYFYYKTLRQNLTNKYTYNNITKLPELKKIILNTGSKNGDIKQLSSSLLSFELLTNQRGILTKTQKPNLLLKIRKGNPTGCKLTLKKSNLFQFFGDIIYRILPMSKNFEGFIQKRNKQKNVFSFTIQSIFTFPELGNHYQLFHNINKLDVTIITSAQSEKELAFLLKLFQIPFKKL